MIDTVLFVDDEHHVLNSINRLFVEEKVKVLSASSADEALNYFNSERIAVVVTDNQMPGMKGIELLSKVKEVSPDTLKILMTGHADLVTAVDAINRGEVFRFLIKPWDDSMLTQIVHEALHRYNLIQELKKNDESSLLTIAQTIELKDPYTRGHCESVAVYSTMIAEKMQLPEEKVKNIRFGSWLHDCGKIGVPETILNKNGTLSEDEYEVIKNHPQWGAEVARQALLSDKIVNIILHHHERYEGGGYPANRRGSEIPFEARIVTIADVFDALTSNRPYRSKFSREKAVEVMQQMSGSVFDPNLLDIFLYECLKAAR
jgi:putative nucleotidyltransferase with HDIG domain